MGAALAICIAPNGAPKEDDSDEDDFEPNPNNPTATFFVAGAVHGTFTVEVFLDRVPLTSSNFLDLASSGFYSGLHFHRVMSA